MILTCEGTEEGGYLAGLIPDVAYQLANGALVSRKAVEDELDIMLTTIRGFWNMEPDQVMRNSSAMSARCTELAVHLHRAEGNREWRQVRTQQVERILAELDRQFKLSSRLVEIRRQDIETSK